MDFQMTIHALLRLLLVYMYKSISQLNFKSDYSNIRNNNSTTIYLKKDWDYVKLFSYWSAK